MKIAIAIFRYFPYGGLQRDMKFIAEEAISRGHQVTIYCGDWQGEKISGAEVRVIDTFVWFNVAGVRRFVKAFEKYFNRNDFDLLLGFNKMPGLDVYFAGDTCFSEKAYQDRSWFYRLAPRSQTYLQYEQSVFGESGAKKIFCLVPQQIHSIARWYSTQAERITLLPPGISKSHIACENPQAAKDNLCKLLQIDLSEKIILCLGSGFRTKGVDISLTSFAEYDKENSNAVLLIAGGDNSRAYQQQAKQLGIDHKIRFITNQISVADLLHAADLLLHPARYELAGNVILEAILCGCPVLVSRQSGFAYYVENFEMGEKIESLIKIPAQIKKLLATEKSVWQLRSLSVWEVDLFSRASVAVNELENFLFSKTLDYSFLDLGRASLCINSCLKEDDEYLVNQLVNEIESGDVFEYVNQIKGVSVRKMADRETIRFVVHDRTYYVKRHAGVGWWEIFKNILQCRMPVLGATNEWAALQKLSALNIPSLQAVAYAVKSKNPARQKSFIITRELTDVIQVDHFLESQQLHGRQRWRLIKKIAGIAREMHAAGINHRDFYLCHFMLKQSWSNTEEPDIYIIDLHRAQIRSQVPYRWLVKDLAALYFSGMSLPVSLKDRLRFLREYFQLPVKLAFIQHSTLLTNVEKKAAQLYMKHEKS